MKADAVADNAFIEEHRDFVERIVDRTVRSLNLLGPRDDFVAAALEGLVLAHGRYDASRGAAFRTFAYYRVRGAVIDQARKSSDLSRSVYTTLRAMAGADSAMEDDATEQAAPGSDIIAESVTSLSRGLLRSAAAFMVSEASHKSASETNEEALQAARTREQVRLKISMLPERERALIEGFYFEDRTLEEIGRELGFSKSWASRLHAKALERIRESLEET